MNEPHNPPNPFPHLHKPPIVQFHASTTMQLTSMVGRCLTMRQKAAAVVASYPVFPDTLAMTALLAEEEEAWRRGGDSNGNVQGWQQRGRGSGDSSTSSNSNRRCPC